MPLSPGSRQPEVLPITIPASSGGRYASVAKNSRRARAGSGRNDHRPPFPNLRLRAFSPRTEEAYTAWTRRFVRFHQMRHPADLGEAEVKALPVHLPQDRHLAPSTLAQALAALLFLYREVLGRPLAGLGAIPRARAPVRLPVVLAQLRGVTRLVALLLYGSGMRLMECVTLRVKDLDIGRRGDPDRAWQGCQGPRDGTARDAPWRDGRADRVGPGAASARLRSAEECRCCGDQPGLGQRS